MILFLLSWCTVMEILNIQDIKQWAESLPFIAGDSVRILYENNYWDGPLEGVLRWNNKNYYFINYSDDDWTDGANRAFVIIEMTKAQEKDENYFHQLFIKYVGSHTDYDEFGNRSIEEVKPESERKKFYDEYDKAEKFTISRSQLKARFK